MKKNKLIWIAIPVIIIIAGVYFAWNKNLIPFIGEKDGSKTKSTGLIEQQNNNSQGVDAESSLSDINLPDDESQDETAGVNSPDEKRSDEKADENLRQQIIVYANQNLNKLATPPANDKWDYPTFYFVGNTNVYVELYAVDADLAGAKILYKAEKGSNGAIKLNEMARYKEGEEDWILSSGQDNLDNYVMEEYDYNEEINKWEKTDEFTEESYSDEDVNLSEEPATGQIIR